MEETYKPTNKNIEDTSLKQLIEDKNKLGSIISDRLDIEQNIGCDTAYRANTRLRQADLTRLLTEISKRFDEKFEVDELGYEWCEDILERGEATAVKDEDGNIIIDKFKTNIIPLDEELLNGGFVYGSLVSLAGSTNAGKSDIAYMFIRSAIHQELKIHLHSYELGYSDLFRLFSHDQKNKLKADLKDAKYQKLFSIDQRAMEDKSLIRMIEERSMAGCRIFILDSLTKIRTKEGMAIKDNVIGVTESLREIAKRKGLLIIIITQKDKQSKIDNRNELYGSIHQEHTFDYMLFIGYEDMDNQETSERAIVMTKNREDEAKKSIITNYDPINHTLFLKEGAETTQAKTNRVSQWADRIKK